ncbi:MAG: queuosine precursor transporter [Candidatus Fermentibacter sp.]|nr:queuosine precursor transporter [Candidatus Fermentibacter sp.]
MTIPPTASTGQGQDARRTPSPSTIAVVSACYLAAQMLSDIASLRIVTLAGLSMDAGTLVYPLTFTLRDLVHKTAGKAAARALIFTAAAVNVFMAGLFWLVSVMRPDPTVGPQEGFGLVLSPVWRIVAASIMAEVLSELLDTEVYSFWVKRFGEGRQWMRVLASNSAAIPVDSAIFCVAAFAGVLPGATLAAVILANILMKFATTLVSLPAIYAVRQGS